MYYVCAHTVVCNMLNRIRRHWPHHIDDNNKNNVQNVCGNYLLIIFKLVLEFFENILFQMQTSSNHAIYIEQTFPCAPAQSHFIRYMSIRLARFCLFMHKQLQIYGGENKNCFQSTCDRHTHTLSRVQTHTLKIIRSLFNPSKGSWKS